MLFLLTFLLLGTIKCTFAATGLCPDLSEQCTSLSATTPLHQTRCVGTQKSLNKLRERFIIIKTYSQDTRASSTPHNDESFHKSVCSTSYTETPESIDLCADKESLSNKSSLRVHIDKSFRSEQQRVHLATFSYAHSNSLPEWASLWSGPCQHDSQLRTIILENRNGQTHLFTYTPKETLIAHPATYEDPLKHNTVEVGLMISHKASLIILAKSSNALLPTIVYDTGVTAETYNVFPPQPTPLEFSPTKTVVLHSEADLCNNHDTLEAFLQEEEKFQTHIVARTTVTWAESGTTPLATFTCKIHKKDGSTDTQTAHLIGMKNKPDKSTSTQKYVILLDELREIVGAFIKKGEGNFSTDIDSARIQSPFWEPSMHFTIFSPDDSSSENKPFNITASQSGLAFQQEGGLTTRFSFHEASDTFACYTCR